MTPFTVLEGLVAPLDRANVDTDAIIPKQFLKSILRTGYGPNLFDEWRYLDQGEPGKDDSKRPLNKDFVLNPKAWRDAQPGEWGTAAAFYNDYRTARRPDEQLSFGKSFQLRERMSLQLRAEFFNAFNRTYLANPDSGNPTQTQTRNAAGVPTSGFGRINPASLANTPRNGQIVARFQW